MDNAAIEQDLGGIGDIVKDAERFVEFIIVVVSERLHPCLDFLSRSVRSSSRARTNHVLCDIPASTT